MKTDNKQLIEILGIVAVVLSLLFVGYEINQNTLVAKAQTRDSMTEKLMNWELSIGSSQYSATVWSKGTSGYYLDPDTGEVSAFNLLASANLRMWENEWYQFQLGLFEEEEFEPRLERWERRMETSPGFQDLWKSARETYAQGFRSIMDEFVSDPTNSNSNGN